MIDYKLIGVVGKRTSLNVSCLQECLSNISEDLPEIETNLKEELAKCKDSKEELKLFREAITSCIDSYIDGMNIAVSIINNKNCV